MIYVFRPFFRGKQLASLVTDTVHGQRNIKFVEIHMEINKNDISSLLVNTYYFHDSNIENINIVFKNYSETDVKDYPKDAINICIEIQLPPNSNSLFSEKRVKIDFCDVEVYKIEKDREWSWLITSASTKKTDESYNVFSIDDYLWLIYKHSSWSFII
jgi:hypothetical protein